jgi:hypothetical protein
MITGKLLTAAATLSLVAVSPAQAQSFAGDATGATGSRAMFGLSIPVGPRIGAHPAQLQLSFDRYRPGTLAPLRGTDFGDRLPREARLGLALDGTGTLSINGRPVALPESRRNLSTGGAIAIGAGVLVVGLLVAFAASEKVPDDFLSM